MFLGRNLWVLMLFVGLSFINVACNSDDDADDNKVNPIKAMTITDIAAGNADFSILVAALKKAGLDDDLASKTSEFTVFAPTNAAFNDLLTELGATSLDDIPDETLIQVLLYHVLSGTKKASMFETGYYSTLSDGPIAGYGLSLYANMELAMLNNRAKIVTTDIEADNGVIHVVDKVILPMTIADHAVANPAFSSLVAVATKAELVPALDDDNATLTVFAPTNDAFAAFLSDLGVGLDDLSKETLASVVLYHAMSGIVPAAQVSAGYFPTLSMAFDRPVSLMISIESGVVLNSSSDELVADVVATNGIIHAINKVILPPTVVDIASANANFSTLVKAVVKAELATTLSGDGPFTVFAPTNDAFDALFTMLGISGVDALTKDDLTPILLAHVVSGNVASTDLSNSTVPTLNTNKSIEINIDNGVVLDGDIQVIAADIQGKNGIVHVIDKVIIP